MTGQDSKEYRININPRILELLGPSLYTNIYYVLSELIANAYDAAAKNVYIIEHIDRIVVEDDGTGMSYDEGDIERYLDVAKETRTSEDESLVEGTERKKMGRKGVGKLAALAVSSSVKVMTRKNGEVSGFVLARDVGEDNLLQPIDDKLITFEKIGDQDGTSVVMENPGYSLNKTAKAIKNNLLKIFPVVNEDFKIHIVPKSGDSITIDNFDHEMVSALGGLITLGAQFKYLAEYFEPQIEDQSKSGELLELRDSVVLPIKISTKEGEKVDRDVVVNGWIGCYRTTSGRKAHQTDFPDNFISILANKKLGEYNILPVVGTNKLPEVYVVGQLHVDILESSELPDMALSNRQGYKTDDPRYVELIDYVKKQLLPEIVVVRGRYADFKKQEKEKGRLERERKLEEELVKKVEEFRAQAVENIQGELDDTVDVETAKKMADAVETGLNEAMPLIGLKRQADANKKRILISHSSRDKVLGHLLEKLLTFNGVPREDLLYTSSDDAECRVPEGLPTLDYLRDFFVKSYSAEQIFVIYITSEKMAESWFAVNEVGAGWIARSDHKVFNINGYIPQKPLDTDAEWHESTVNDDEIKLSQKEFDKLIIKVISVSESLGYKAKSKELNTKELDRLGVVLED